MQKGEIFRWHWTEIPSKGVRVFLWRIFPQLEDFSACAAETIH
jgi:hypothetical protein